MPTTIDWGELALWLLWGAPLYLIAVGAWLMGLAKDDPTLFQGPVTHPWQHPRTDRPMVRPPRERRDVVLDPTIAQDLLSMPMLSLPPQTSSTTSTPHGTPMPDQDKDARIARLIAQGEMTHENPGQYIADGVDAKSTASIPQYDPDVVREQLPDILQMDFDEDGSGCFAILRDGRTGDEVKVPFGDNPPPTTEALVEAIRAFYRDGLDTDAMDETAGLFDAIEGDDG